MKTAMQQRQQFLVALLVAVIILGVVIACSPTIRHNFKDAFGSLGQWGNSPEDYYSPEARRAHALGQDPGMYSPAEERRIQELQEVEVGN